MQSHSLSQLPISGNEISPHLLQLEDLEKSHRHLKTLEAKLKSALTIDQVHQASQEINQTLVAFSNKAKSFIAGCIATS